MLRRRLVILVVLVALTALAMAPGASAGNVDLPCISGLCIL